MKLSKIKKITKIDGKLDRYDLTIKSTSNFFANGILIHNTSGRASHTKIIKNKPLSFFQKIKKKIGLDVKPDKEEYWDYIAGTRNVTLLPADKDKEGFHGPEGYRFEILESFKPYLEKGMTVFFEIYGFANGRPIMAVHDTEKLKDKAFSRKYGPKMVYKYGCAEDEYRIMVYRIQVTGEGGESIDFTPPQIQGWCEKRNFNYSKPLKSFLFDGDKETLFKEVKDLAERESVLCEDYTDSSHINEGIVCRVDYKGLTPTFYKYKSFPFKVLEGIAKEKEIDLEDIS